MEIRWKFSEECYININKLCEQTLKVILGYLNSPQADKVKIINI